MARFGAAPVGSVAIGEVIMRYLFGFMCVCALGMVASIGCSEPEINLCETVDNCVAQGHSCNPGHELYCRLDGVCDCKEVAGTGGTGGSAGSGGSVGSGGSAGSGGSGNECGRNVTCDVQDTNSCLATCEGICGIGNVSVHTCFTDGDADVCYCICDTGECIGG